MDICKKYRKREVFILFLKKIIICERTRIAFSKQIKLKETKNDKERKLKAFAYSNAKPQ